MKNFSYARPASIDEALEEIVRHPQAKFLAGGTNLVDLMKYQVERPDRIIDINHLDLAKIESLPGGGMRIGALARNDQMANHPEIRTKYPLLSEALLSGASPQLRNSATAAGNLLQRTRCYYFYDVGFEQCNKRKPGSGCSALDGVRRIHAILGGSDHCIATNPSDMSVALAALEAVVQVRGPKGKRGIPLAEFHRLPGDMPQLDTTLHPAELITSVDLPAGSANQKSNYVKVRDRNSYAFALVSVAAAVTMDGSTIKKARLALGGVAHKPWRVPEAEQLLAGKPASREAFLAAANIILRGAKTYPDNAFKVELAKRAVVRALSVVTEIA